MPVVVEFCGEPFEVDPVAGLTIGREGDVAIDDNPYLHRSFLTVHAKEGVWVLTNVGSRLSATVVDPSTRLEAHLTPGASLALVFERTVVAFSAGATSYDLEIRNSDSLLRAPYTASDVQGTTTLGGVLLNREQRLLVLSLAEPRLTRDGSGPSQVPTSREAAARLGWTLTKFNRKLDHLCQRLHRAGVRGLHGGPGELASQRRARLVEYTVAAGVITADDLGELSADEGAIH